MTGKTSKSDPRTNGGSRVPLVRHPMSDNAGADGVGVVVARVGAGLSLHYSVTGEIGRIVLPAQRASARADGLWKQTCFEAFVSDGAAYCEFNFSPSTQWAAYRFSEYRDGMAAAETPPPQIEFATAPDQIDLYTELLLDSLPLTSARPWRLGLSAVIKTSDGGTSYWALSHGEGQPDFHRACCFAMQIP